MMMLAVPVTEASSRSIGAAQLASLDREEVVGDVEVELRAELLEAEEVGVQAPASDLVAARLGDVAHAEAGEHRADEHHRAAQAAQRRR